MRSLLFAIFLVASFALSAWGNAEEELQRQFLLGAQHFHEGDYRAAEAAYRSLLNQTNSPRIKLELARTLLHLGKLPEAKTLFQEVYRLPDTPWTVKNNIQYFIKEIEGREGYVRFSANLVADTNPRNFTSQREFNFGGIEMTLKEPEDNKPVIGVRYHAEGYTPLNKKLTLGAYASVSFIDFPHIAFDRLSSDLGFEAKLPATYRHRARAGVEINSLAGELLYHFPYVAFLPLIAETPRDRVHAELKLGQVKYRDYEYLDGPLFTAGISAARNLSTRLILTATGTCEYARAREDAYSYRGLGFSPSASYFFPSMGILSRVSLFYGLREYEAADPFFGMKRSDKRKKIELALSDRKRLIWNHYLGISFGLEENHSNLDFYSYQKFNLAFSLEQ